ncbi:MAG: nucleoside hydrolase [Bacteroidota bacterium]
MRPKNKIICWLLFVPFLAFSQSLKKVVIDADTGNEVDDLYAIVRGLVEPSWEVIALNATQWQPAHWAVEQSMEESYRLNQVLLGHLAMAGKVKSYRGGLNRLFDWGDLAQYSAAAHHLIKVAHTMPADEKLTVIALGALTNVASALLIDPSITNKISVYWLGTTYDFEQDILRKRDFNCMMDQQALAELLDSKVDLHIIPVSVANQMTFTYEETVAKLAGKAEVLDFIIDRWTQHLDGGRKERVIWDLALIEAIIHPKWAEKVEVLTSKENGNRKVWYYKNIDEDRMRVDFFAVMSGYFRE